MGAGTVMVSVNGMCLNRVNLYTFVVDGPGQTLYKRNCITLLVVEVNRCPLPLGQDKKII